MAQAEQMKGSNRRNASHAGLLLEVRTDRLLPERSLPQSKHRRETRANACGITFSLPSGTGRITQCIVGEFAGRENPMTAKRNSWSCYQNHTVKVAAGELISRRRFA